MYKRQLVDLRDNGKRNINKYQPMFEKENDLKALYAETNEDWHGKMCIRDSRNKREEEHQLISVQKDKLTILIAEDNRCV